MDTDELSEETYGAIIIGAEEFHHNLALQFGLLADTCSDDDEYLMNANNLIVEWKADLAGSIDEIFFDSEPPTALVFEKFLSKLQEEIVKVQNIPIEKRKFEA